MIRPVFSAFCVIACLLTTPASATCQDFKEQVRENQERSDELMEEQALWHDELLQTQDPTQRHEIELHIEDIEHNRARFAEEITTLNRALQECEQQPVQNGEKGHSPLIIAAIIGATGAVLAALIGLFKRR